MRDTLSPNFKIETIKLGSSSHPYTFTIYGPRILEWTFARILLPDSNINEIMSHGFLTYTVEKEDSLDNGDELKNSASIYFDFNDPIITNETILRIKDPLYEIPSKTDTIKLSQCDPVTYQGITYEKSGVYYQSSKDSIIVLDFEVKRTFSDTSSSTCNPYLWYGNPIDSTGTYRHALTNSNNCDSILTLHATIGYVSDTSRVSCYPFTWNGLRVDSSNTYRTTLKSKLGCDSIVTLYATINTDRRDTSATACEKFSWYNQTITTTGIYTHALVNSFGCATVVTLHAIINSVDSVILQKTNCNSHTWNGNVYSKSKKYYYTYSNSDGCDSLATLDLTIYSSSTTTSDTCVFNSYFWDYNNQTYTEGSYTEIDSLTSVNGCDSIIIGKITIYPLDTVIVSRNDSLLTSNYWIPGLADPFHHNWINCETGDNFGGYNPRHYFVPTENGSYTASVIAGGCIDTLSCINVENSNSTINISKLNLTVNPNPTNDGSFTITLEEKIEDVSVVVHTSTGQVASINQYKFFLEENLMINGESGLYIISIYSKEKQIAHIKIIKK